MVQVIFTLDYEIHGNGEGSPRELMVEPTERLLALFDRFGARLTILADIGEILKFKQYAETHGQRDDYSYQAIVLQLQQAIRRGHDVQLHIHSSYFNATHDGDRWVQDWSEYSFAKLPAERIDYMVAAGKHFLETILRPVYPGYQCNVFRAANWSVSPSANIVRALLKHDIRIDTSVFKFGRREGLVDFDYSDAPSAMLPWRADANALWRESSHGPIWEVPIYCENRSLGAFLSLNRFYRVLCSRSHRMPASSKLPGNEDLPPGSRGVRTPPRAVSRLKRLARRHAWKADFNQCTGRQLIRALNRGAAVRHSEHSDAPFVLIGHSKLFTPWNERALRPFLSYVQKNGSRFAFGTFQSLGLPALEAQRKAPVSNLA